MKTVEQIRAMLEAGFSDAQIKTFLNVEDEDIEVARNSCLEEEPKTEEPETHKLERVGQNGRKINEENFSPIKQDIDNGMSKKEICEKYGIADALYYKIKKSPTFEDFCDLRKIEAKKKQERPASIENINKARAVAIENRREKGRETYNKYKELLKNRTMSYGKFAKEYGISPTTAWRIDNSDTVEEYLKSIASENEKKRSVKKPFERNQTEPKQEEPNVDTATPGKVYPSPEEFDPKLVEFRSMADSLARIAEALEKIATKKRGLFRK